MNLEHRECPRCQRKGLIVLEGPELEPICLDCLKKLDPVRWSILSRIADRRKPQ